MTKRILLIDDDGLVRGIVPEMLSEYDVTVTLASNGGEGIYEFISNGPFDVILLDLLMPGVDGEAFLRILGCLKGKMAPLPPVIVITSVEDFARLSDTASDPLIHSLLQKPISQDSLVGHLKEAWRGKELDSLFERIEQ